MTYYGVMKDYDYSDSHKRELLTIWSGPFAGIYEGRALSLPKGDGYMITTYYGEKIRVSCLTPRTEATYEEIDAAINVAVNEFYAKKEEANG